MPTHATTLDDRWSDHYLSAMVLYHTLLGHDMPGKPRTEPTPEVLVQILNKVICGKYARSDSDYFAAGPSAQFTVLSKPPPLAEGARYALISLNATTARSEFISVRTGGIVFEDPVWAVLAAHALSRKLAVALPIAKTNDELWEKLSVVAKAVRERKYVPQDFLGATTAFVPPDTSPKFELIDVDADKVALLRSRGMQSLRVTATPKFFELFVPPVETRQ